MLSSPLTSFFFPFVSFRVFPAENISDNDPQDTMLKLTNKKQGSGTKV